VGCEGVTAAAAKEEEEDAEERRRSFGGGGGARGRRREARRSEALAQRSAARWAAASGAGLVCFSMADGDGDPFSLGGRGGWGVRLLEGAGRFLG
jgi:hypothetical protein